MNRATYLEIYNKSKTFYFAIGSMRSSLFEDERIEFGRAGWRHIIWKKDEPRPEKDKLRRFYLLKHAERVVANGRIVHYREDIRKGVIGRFWKLHLKIDHRSIKVVIRQIGSSPKHFFSIMN